MEESVGIPVSYNTKEEKAPESVLKSGRLLRREYILKEKALFTQRENRGPSEKEMDKFAQDAKYLYPQQGTYEVKGEEVKWLGNY